MTAFYNEIEPFAADWLRGLIREGMITDGRVETRSVANLTASDLATHTRHHFFAGIGGWDLALRLAGWPVDAPVWTGSCPCQPFSSAGRGRGFADGRHLWPVWFKLIRECRPSVIFGEQVASSAGLAWLDAVQADLEGAGYAVGAADLCAAGVGAPHIRQRLYWVAYAAGERRDGLDALLRPEEGRRRGANALPEVARSSAAHRMGDAECIRVRKSRPGEEGRRSAREFERSSQDCWGDVDWVQRSDGKLCPIEPGTHPLAYGVPGRVGLLRGYGNAIVPEVAATFIRAAMPFVLS